ncbi:MAG: prolipoprotein diacylglyceryl transferase [Acidimicrobiia bacterium]|nr:prolipoprotein diacylglyceryl transferase [Acidimicrobiia bacterium]
MIPYVELHSIQVGLIRIPVQPLLAAVGIMTGHFLFIRRARRQGLEPAEAASMSFWMVAAGLAGAHLFRFLYLPDLLSNDPWIWAKTTAGLSSFGGLSGGLIGAGAYARIRGMPQARLYGYLDSLAYVFPSAWIFGRLGCSLVHDHPGLRSTSVLAVNFPRFPRFDLGVIELLFLAVVIVPLFLILDRRPRPAVFYLPLLLCTYGLFRILLDRLHVDPPRYFGLSVDTVAYGLLVALGFYQRRHGRLWAT